AYRCRGLPAYIGCGSVWTVLGRRNEKPHLGPVFLQRSFETAWRYPLPSRRRPHVSIAPPGTADVALQPIRHATIFPGRSFCLATPKSL
ncbi:hypothetical protein M3665_25270, partial [Bacillus licheniformis]|nr:hypothetical protein [Bacillus licheniformis]